MRRLGVHGAARGSGLCALRSIVHPIDHDLDLVACWAWCSDCDWTPEAARAPTSGAPDHRITTRGRLHQAYRRAGLLRHPSCGHPSCGPPSSDHTFCVRPLASAFLRPAFLRPAFLRRPFLRPASYGHRFSYDRLSSWSCVLPSFLNHLLEDGTVASSSFRASVPRCSPSQVRSWSDSPRYVHHRPRGIVAYVGPSV